jgi:hypothetical protein
MQILLHYSLFRVTHKLHSALPVSLLQLPPAVLAPQCFGCPRCAARPDLGEQERCGVRRVARIEGRSEYVVSWRVGPHLISLKLHDLSSILFANMQQRSHILPFASSPSKSQSTGPSSSGAASRSDFAMSR